MCSFFFWRNKRNFWILVDDDLVHIGLMQCWCMASTLTISWLHITWSTYKFLDVLSTKIHLASLDPPDVSRIVSIFVPLILIIAEWIKFSSLLEQKSVHPLSHIPFPYFLLPLPISLTTSSESPKKQPDAARTKARKNTMRGEGEGTEVCNHKSPSNNEK